MRTIRENAKMNAPTPVLYTDSDRTLEERIREITSKGNNVEVKQKSDGTLVLMEVRKKIV